MWYKGEITNAIKQSKDRKVVFVVYVQGQDELSEKMNRTWQDEQIIKFCEKQTIAVQLQANSSACAQFCEFYPVVCVPSTFFIAYNGELLEVIGGHVENSQLLNKVQTIAQKHKERFGEVIPAASSPTQPTATWPLTETVTQAVSHSGAEGAANPSTSSLLTKEEKIEKAKMLLAQKREEKAREEEEKRKREEIERRKLGRDVGKLKEWQAEKDMREAAEALKKDREEQQRLKAKVKADIERDRQEKKVRFEEQKVATESNLRQRKEETELSRRKENQELEQEKRKFTRVQFRLPDGSSLTNTFNSTQTLGEVRLYLLQQIGNRFGNFSLRTVYPKRDFTVADQRSSLLDLDLVASVALVIVPGNATSTVKPVTSTGSFGLISLVFAPFLWLWGIISCFFFAAAPTTARQGSNQSTVDRREQPRTSQLPLSDKTSRENRPKSSYGKRSLLDGNMHRLRNADDDDDDDMASYNGNSTQQL